jgi:hypothetical protein
MVAYLQKPAVQMVLFGTAVLGAMVFFYTKDQQPVQTDASQAPPPPKGLGQAAPESVAVKQSAAIETTETKNVSRLWLDKPKPEPPTIVKEEPKPEQKPPTPAFPDLVQMSAAAQPKPFVAEPPKLFAPRGTLIKAALVITLESNAIGTPVLGLVTEDVYFQGDLILPAGTQVQAESMGNSKFRDRIDIRGTFNFIWADGSEYMITGVALDHQPLPDGTFSLTDGSPGIRGRVLKTDEYAEFKLLVAEAVKGLMVNNQSQFQSIYGMVPENTNRNAALGSGSSGAGAYAGLLAKRIEKDLEYVQVPAGTSFYIYTTEVFEPEMRSIAGLRQGNKPVTGVEDQRKAFEAASAQAAMTESEMSRRLAEARAVEAANAKAKQQAEQMERTKALFAPGGPRPTTPPPEKP